MSSLSSLQFYLDFKHRYYTASPELLSPGVEGDKVFPYFIVHGLPTGLTGLVIASLFSAGMSTIATSINSSATIIYSDFFKRGKNFRDSRDSQMKILYLSSFFVGVAGVVIGVAMQKINGVLDAWWKLSSIFSGGMLGLFLLALVKRRMAKWAVVSAVIAGLLVIAYLSLPVFESGIHTYLTIVFGTTTIFIVGFVLSYIYEKYHKTI